MSMISEQVKELREMADYWKSNVGEPQNALRKAADTIEALSEKLEAANMKNSGGWIPCSEKLPKCSDETETDALMFQMKDTGTIEIGYYGRGGRFRDSYFRHYRDYKEGVDSKDVIAWRQRPELYKGEVSK